jgi:hypothetical protein
MSGAQRTRAERKPIIHPSHTKHALADFVRFRPGRRADYIEQTTVSEIAAMLFSGMGTQSLVLKGTSSAAPVAIRLLNA